MCKYFTENVFKKDRSPVYNHAMSTSTGVVTIRASNNQQLMLNQYYSHSDKHTKVFFANIAISRWFGMRLDMILNAFIFVSIFSAVFFKGFFVFFPIQNISPLFKRSTSL
jgi:hypothetical protein